MAEQQQQEQQTTAAAAGDSELRMSLFDHLNELRKRLFKCTLAVLVLGAASLVFARPMFGFLMQPVLDALPEAGRSLVYTSGIEELNVLMKVGMYAGIFLATPVILWQLWGFVAPGLYREERRMVGPFVALGTLAFVAGGLFCYYGVLPTMFEFLLKEGQSAELQQRIDTAKLQEDDALRFLRLGDADRAATLARAASAALAVEPPREEGTPLVPKALQSGPGTVEINARIEQLGRLLDATADGFGAPARAVLRQAADKRVEAVALYGQGDFAGAGRALDDAAALLAGAAPAKADEMAALWRLGRELSAGHARHVAEAWTKPMLTMREQLSLVLVLLLAFGVIFELPLVMAVLGLFGIVTSKFLFRYQRHAFVVCLVLAAILTPTGDIVNLSLMGGPMILCYELGLVAVWLIERRRTRNAPAAITPAA